MNLNEWLNLTPIEIIKFCDFDKTLEYDRRMSPKGRAQFLYRNEFLSLSYT